MGALLIARVRTAAMAGARLAPHERRPFHVFIDEAQNFATNSLPALLAEGKNSASRFATRHRSSLVLPSARAALLGSTGSIAAFRMGPEEGDVLAPKFNRLHQEFNANVLNELERGEAMIKIGADDGHRVRLPPPDAGFGNAEIVRRQARQHYGRPRADVERHIGRLLAAQI